MVARCEEQRQEAVEAGESEGEEAASRCEGLQEPDTENEGPLGLV